MQEHSAPNSLWFQYSAANEVINRSRAHAKEMCSPFFVYQDRLDLMSVLLFARCVHSVQPHAHYSAFLQTNQ
jgi:hypothetical protein